MSIEELSDDPHPHLARLRDTAPVAFVVALGGWLVTSRALAVAVLRDPLTFTVDDPRFTTARLTGPSMLSTDGVEHERHRRPFAGPLRPRHVVERFAPTVQSLVDGALGRMQERGGRRAEVRADIAGPVAAGAMAEMLGLDGHDPSTVDSLLVRYRNMVSAVESLSAGGDDDDPVVRRGHEAMSGVAGDIGRAAADSLLGEVAAAGDLDAAAVTANAAVVMFGGIETTEGLILNAVRHALLAPGLADRLVTETGPAVDRTVSVAMQVVDESLRLEPPAAVVDRYATRDVTLGDALIAAGELVMVSLAAANRDPVEFDHPDAFRPGRANVMRHLAFATGPHVCIGLELARLQAAVVVSSLFGVLSGVALGPDAPPPTGLVFRKPASLPITWKAVR